MAENASKTRVGRPFEPGNKGGPGRPAIPKEFKAKCKDATDEHVFKAWLEEVESRGEYWPQAAEKLAAYGYGKPAQAVEVSGKDGAPLSIVFVREGAE